MESFGQLLRYHRRHCSDPMRGGLLTQERFGELIGYELGDAGFTGAAVSDWERDKSRINVDDRIVLISIITILHNCGGLNQPEEANQLLNQGNYRGLDASEQGRIFPDLPAPPIKEPASEASSTEIISPPAILTQDRKRQLILLNKVKSFWVQGVLARSIKDNYFIDLSMKSVDEVIEMPWQDVISKDVKNDDSTTSQDDILNIYQNSDRALLILGNPGVGKTTSLLALAEGLIDISEKDDSAPLPVILNLSSWAEKKERLSEWIVEELTAKYQIPRKAGRNWLANDQLILLLDGLDNVVKQYQPACVEAINRFREEHGLSGIVICCRQEEYQVLEIKLKLGGAILLQPLTPKQINTYLTVNQNVFSGLRTAIQQNKELTGFINTPLMLNVFRTVFEAEQQTGLDSSLDSTEMASLGKVKSGSFNLDLIFESYLYQMNVHYPSKRYALSQIKQWMRWLAQRMNANYQTQFLIEKIQPSWLTNRHWRVVYLLGSRLIDGIAIGVFIWLLSLLILLARPESQIIWAGNLLNNFPLSPLWRDLLALIIHCSILGIVVAIIDIFFYERRLSQQQNFALSNRLVWGQTLLTGLIVGILATSFLASQRPLIALSFGLSASIAFMLTTHYIHGWSYFDDIRTVEALHWSWRGAIIGALLGLFLGAIVELFELLEFGPSSLLPSIALLTAAFMITGGLNEKRVTEKSRPNEGIRLSATNAAMAALLLGIPVGLIGILLFGVEYGLVSGILAAVVAAALFGASNVVNHYYLRFLICRSAKIPWALEQFLNEAARQIILYKVGGSYIFIHPMMQEHFTKTARNNNPSPSPRSNSPSPI